MKHLIDNLNVKTIAAGLDTGARKLWISPAMRRIPLADSELGLGVGADLIIIGTS
ncbi:MAG: hypothetical protein WDN08_00190 [Rhizomicrobium sp.]